MTWQLAPDSGWGRYSLGLVRGLNELGVETVTLTERRSAAPSGWSYGQVIPCLSTPLASLDHPAALVWNTAQVLKWRRGSDLVHFFVEPYAMTSALFFPWRSLITVHGTYGVIPLRGNLVTRSLFARVMRRASAVVCVSRFTRGRVAAALPLDNLEVIANGFDRLDPGDSPDNDPIVGDPVLLGVGALKPRKGYHVGVEAVARIRETFPDVHYYLVGDDRDTRYLDQLHELVAKHGLESSVTITGRVSDARLDALYRRADVFILTPVNSGAAFEGFGLTYLEANSYGKPVIGSLDCGAEDAVTDGDNGYLAPQGDAGAVASLLTKILLNPAEAAELGRRGRERATRQDWTYVSRSYLSLYERVCAG